MLKLQLLTGFNLRLHTPLFFQLPFYWITHQAEALFRPLHFIRNKKVSTFGAVVEPAYRDGL